jgi:hypothetical protein
MSILEGFVIYAEYGTHLRWKHAHMMVYKWPQLAAIWMDLLDRRGITTSRDHLYAWDFNFSSVFIEAVDFFYAKNTIDDSEVIDGLTSSINDPIYQQSECARQLHSDLRMETIHLDSNNPGRRIFTQFIYNDQLQNPMDAQQQLRLDSLMA